MIKKGLVDKNFPEYLSSLIIQINSFLAYIFIVFLYDIQILSSLFKERSDSKEYYRLTKENIISVKLRVIEMQNNLESFMNNHFGIFVNDLESQSCWEGITSKITISGVKTYCTLSLFEIVPQLRNFSEKFNVSLNLFQK